MLPVSATLPPRNPQFSPWSELTPAERRTESPKMELYAAMVENLDRHVGRLLDYLKRTDQYDSTLVLFMSDNGAAGEDPYNVGPFVATLRDQYENDYDEMGHRDSFVSYGPAWAEAGSAPFRLYKGYTTEGGIAAPLIIAGPDVVARNMISTVYVTVMDIAPTLIEIADATYPADGSVRPMLGKSFHSLLTGEAGTVHAEDDVTVLFYRGRAFVRQGRWKITVAAEPFDERKFQLYDVLPDQGETRDLSAALPDKYAELIRLWQTHRRELGIVLPEDL
jgi:arylsulfatase